MNQITHPVIAATMLAVYALGCGNQESPQPPASSTVPLPQSLIAAAAPANAVGVVEARKNVEPGARIVITGYIGGRVDPFVDNRAAFTLADAKALVRCDANPDDHCKTPWDACCETHEKLKTSIATVQAVDDGGLVLKQTLKGFGGIKPGSYVTVQGKVAPGATSDALVINAEKIHLTPAQ